MLVGDGYRGKTSPHTPNEKFEGATVLKALKVNSLFPLSLSSWEKTEAFVKGRLRKKSLEGRN